MKDILDLDKQPGITAATEALATYRNALVPCYCSEDVFCLWRVSFERFAGLPSGLNGRDCCASKGWKGAMEKTNRAGYCELT